MPQIIHVFRKNASNQVALVILGVEFGDRLQINELYIFPFLFLYS